MTDLPAKAPADQESSLEPTLNESVATALEDVLNRILVGVAAVGWGGGLLYLARMELATALTYGIVASGLFGLSRAQHRPFIQRAIALLAVFYLAGVGSLLHWGIGGPGSLYLVALPPLAILLLGEKVKIPVISLSMLTWVGMGISLQALQISTTPLQDPVLSDWLYASVNLLLVILALIQYQSQFHETQDFVLTVTQQKQDLQQIRGELLRQTKELDYERYLLHTLLDTVSDKIFFKDLSGRYTRISHAVAQQFGVEPHNVISKTDFDFYALEYAARMQAEEREMLQTGEPVLDRVEKETWLDGRSDTWAIKSRLLLKGPDGRYAGWFGTARDITDIKQAQEADQRHAQQLATVAEVSRAVTSSLDIQLLLGTLVELVQQSFGYYGVNVWLIPETGEFIQLQAGFSPAGEDLSQAGLQISKKDTNSIALVCDTGVHRLLDNVQAEPDFPLKEIFPNTRSQIVQPLRIADKTIGALDILSDQAAPFHDDDVILLRALADQVTIAIRNATLYQSEKSRRNLAETLYQVGEALSSTLNLNEVLDLILEQLDQIVPADRAALMLREQDENVLQIVAARGFPSDSQPLSLQVTIGEGDVFQQIYKSRQSLSISDVYERPDWQQVESLAQARSWLGVPLIRSDEVIGMLSLTREELKPYTLSEETLAATFAGQAAVALENARLYDSVMRFSHHLEEMVQERTEELHKAYDQLERLDRTKTDFIQIVAHELRTPLTVLSGYSQMLMNDNSVGSNTYLQSLARGLQSGSMRMYEIVNSMLDIAKIDSSALILSPEPLSIASLIHNLSEKYASTLKERKLEFVVKDVDDLPKIEADTDALHKIFYELVGNAIKFTPDSGRITVSGRMVTPEETGIHEDCVEIVVSDTGIGINPDDQELIFTKFFQTGEVALHSTSKTKFKGGGPGLGLTIARGIIQAHRGKLWVESQGHDEVNCPGSHFHVVLPIEQKSHEET